MKKIILTILLGTIAVALAKEPTIKRAAPITDNLFLIHDHVVHFLDTCHYPVYSATQRENRANRSGLSG